MIREYSNTSLPTALSADIDDDDITIPVVSTAGLPTPPFTVAINQGTADEEICLVEGVTSNSLTSVTRGYDETEARAATAGDDVRHVVIALDYREMAEHQASRESEHIPAGFGPVPWSGPHNQIPTGWLWCDGSAVSREDYADLFDAIGVDWGEGNGTTTFNVPDCRGRMLIGLDNLGGTPANRVTDAAADTVGGSGGVAAVTLTEDQIPVHTHGESEHTHTFGSHMAAGGTPSPPNPVIGQHQSPSQGVTVTTGPAVGATTSSEGGDDPHSNMPPWLAIHWIVKT